MKYLLLFFSMAAFGQDLRFKEVEFENKVYSIPTDWFINDYLKDDLYDFSVKTPDNEVFILIKNCHKVVDDKVKEKNIIAYRLNSNFLNSDRSTWEFHPESCGSIDFQNDNNVEFIMEVLNYSQLLTPNIQKNEI